MLAHRPEPRTHKLTAPIAADDSQGSKIVRQCQIMALATVLDCSPTRILSFLSFLFFLPGTATMYPLCLSTARMTQSYVSPYTVTSSMDYTSMATDLMGASGIAVYTGLPAVEWFAVFVARQTAQSLQYLSRMA